MNQQVTLRKQGETIRRPAAAEIEKHFPKRVEPLSPEELERLVMTDPKAAWKRLFTI